MIELSGRGLFSGAPARVRLLRTDAEVHLRIAGQQVPLSLCRAQEGVLCTDLIAPHARLRGVEHWAAAAAGLSLHAGYTLEVLEGEELPLLDGAALEWTHALTQLEIQPTPPRLRIARAAEIVIDEASYTLTPGDRCALDVELQTTHPTLARHARWDGDARTFTQIIAPARTFAFAADLTAYAARGATPHVEPHQVVIVDDVVHSAGRAASVDEPVRHKLLDLMGDLYTYGGPPRGAVRARAPGHGKTHRMMQRALAMGVIQLLLWALLTPSAARAQQRFEPSPLTMPTLVHLRPKLATDARLGFLRGDGVGPQGASAILRHGYELELPVLPRRVYLAMRYAFASGHSLLANEAGPLATTSALISGNTQLSVRSLWVAPGGLALGGALDLTAPTAYYARDTAAGDVARAAQALSPNDMMMFLPRTFGVRPTFDVRIRAAGFTFQLRQSLTLGIGVADSTDSAMIAELGLYVGQQIGAVQIGLELAELYYLDTLVSPQVERSDISRARFVFIPQVRMAKGAARPAIGVMYSPSSAYDGASLLSLNLSVDFAMH